MITTFKILITHISEIENLQHVELIFVYIEFNLNLTSIYTTIMQKSVNLFHNETVVGKNGPSNALTRPNIGLKRTLGFHANKNHEAFSILQWIL